MDDWQADCDESNDSCGMDGSETCGNQLSILAKLEVYQRVIREWAEHLTIYEIAVLLQIVDRTIGWGEYSTTLSVRSLIEGRGAYRGLAISRRQIFKVLASLERKKVIYRRLSKAGLLRITFDPKWSPHTGT